MKSFIELEKTIETFVSSSLDSLGYELVQAKVLDPGGGLLQIMCERKSREMMTIEDCVKISNEISGVLTGEGLLPKDWRLEVSSPGVDRPLVKPSDYDRFKGHEISVEALGFSKKKKPVKGKLLGISGNLVKLFMDGETLELDITAITKANLFVDGLTGDSGK
mgnify:FL=1